MLAEPEGYVRVFLDGGQPDGRPVGVNAGPRGVVVLRSRAPHFVRAGGETFPRLEQDLVEPLSGRELEVLGLLATDLDGPGIARELVVSLSTIRSHTKAIYAKLGVTSRRAAVRRGEELDLLSRSDRPRDRATTNA